MRFFVEKISRLRFSWNRRPLVEADFYRLCKRFKITVTEMPLQTNGFYFCLKGRHFIALDSRLSGHRKLFVMFHELGHFLMHTPDSGTTANFHGIGVKTRKESEADAFALCAIMPRAMVESRTPGEIEEHDGLPPDFVDSRLRIYRAYKI